MMFIRRRHGRHVAPSRARLTAAGLLVAVGIAVSLLLSGCGGVSLAQQDDRPGRTLPAPSAQPAPSVRAAAGDGTVPVGKTAVFRSGVSVTVSAPARYRPAGSAAGWMPGQLAYKVRVTVVNGGSDPFDAMMLTMVVSTGPDGAQASQVFDTASGVAAFEGTIPAGGRKTATLGFAVDPSAVGTCVIEIRPDWSGQLAMFKGAIR